MQPTHPQKQKWDRPIKGVEVNEVKIKEHAQKQQTNPNPDDKKSQTNHKTQSNSKRVTPIWSENHHLKFRDRSSADLIPLRSVHVGKLNGFFQHHSKRRWKSKNSQLISYFHHWCLILLSSFPPLNLAFFVLRKMGSEQMRFKGAGRRDSRFSRGDNPDPTAKSHHNLPHSPLHSCRCVNTKKICPSLAFSQ